MSDYSILDCAMQLGGVVSQVVDTVTGEVASADDARGGPVRGGALAASAAGLSTAHICTWAGGGLISAHKGGPGASQVGGGRRGKIAGFSRSSRVRLMRTIARTQKRQLPVFVTLTYPGVWSDDPTRWKRDLRVWWMRVRRLFSGASGVWKLEFQKRGAPHFHLLIWGVDYAHLLCNVGRLWYQVVGSGDERHLRAGCRVEKVRSWKGVLSYASKYLGKVEIESANISEPGRFWGVMSSDCVPWADMVVIPADYRGVCQVIRLMRRFMHVRGRDYRSLTAFADGSFWLDRLDRLLSLSLPASEPLPVARM